MEQTALHQRASILSDDVELLDGFHPFGRRAHAQRLGKFDDRAKYCTRVHRDRKIANEDLSILILWNGTFVNELSDEYPVPKSSIAISTPRSHTCLRVRTTCAMLA